MSPHAEIDGKSKVDNRKKGLGDSVVVYSFSKQENNDKNGSFDKVGEGKGNFYVREKSTFIVNSMGPGNGSGQRSMI